MYPFFDFWIFGFEYFEMHHAISTREMDMSMQEALVGICHLTGWPLQDPEFTDTLHNYFWELAEEEFGDDCHIHEFRTIAPDEIEPCGGHYEGGFWITNPYGSGMIEVPDAVGIVRQPGSDDMWMFQAWPDVCYEDATEQLCIERDNLRFKVRDRRIQSFSRAGRVKQWTSDHRRNTSDWHGKKTRPFMDWAKQMKNAVRFDQMEEYRFEIFLAEYCQYFHYSESFVIRSIVENIRYTHFLGGYYHGTDEQRAEQKRLRHARKEAKSSREHVGMPKASQECPDTPGFGKRKMKRNPSLRQKLLPYERKAGRLRERTTQAILDRALELHRLGKRRVITIQVTNRPYRDLRNGNLIWTKEKQTIKLSGVFGMKRNGLLCTSVLCLKTKQIVKIGCEKNITYQPRKGSSMYLYLKKFPWLT